MKKIVSLLLILSLTLSMLSPSGAIFAMAANIPQGEQQEQGTEPITEPTQNTEPASDPTSEPTQDTEPSSDPTTEPVQEATVTVTAENCKLVMPDGTVLGETQQVPIGTTLTFQLVPLGDCEPDTILLGSITIQADPEDTCIITVTKDLHIIAKCNDTAAPILSDPVRTAEGWAESAQYTFTGSDNIGIVSVKQIDGEGRETELVPDQDGIYTAAIPTNGTYTIVAADSAGNTAQTAITEDRVDTSVPVITKLERQTEGIAQGAIYLLSAEDPESGIAMVTIREGDKEASELKVQEDGSYQIEISNRETYTIEITNAAGGKEIKKIMDEEIDNDPPEIQDLLRTEEGWQKESTEYRFNVADTLSGVASVQFGQENGTYEEVEANEDGSYTVKVFANGTYEIIAADTLGNTKTLTFTETQIDTSEPSVTAIRVEEGWSLSSSYTITAKDAESGIASILVTDADGNEISCIKQEDGSLLLNLTENGNYTVTAENAAGLSTKTQISETQIDTSAPVIGTVNRLTDQWEQKAVYSFTITEEGSGVAEVAVRIGDKEPTLLIGEDGLYTFTMQENASFEITVVDAAGNKDVFSGAENKVDITAPNVTAPVRAEEAWSETAIYTFQAEDLQSGILSVILTLENGDEVPLTSNNNTYTFTLTSNGSFTVRVSDTLGNTETISGNEDRIDTEQPEISAPERSISGWTPFAEYTIQVRDPGSGIRTVTVMVNGQPAQYEEENGAYTFRVTENGTIEIFAADNLGHEMAVVIEETMIDTAQPEISELTRTEEGWATSATYTFRAEDDLSGVAAVRLTAGDKEPILLVGTEGEYTFTLEENTNFYIEAEDAAGNKSGTDGSEQYIDITAPALTTDISREKEGWATQTEYSFGVQDSQSGILSVTVREGDSEPAELTPGEDGLYRFPAQKNGAYTVTVTDSVGNVMEETVKETQIDTTDPAVSEPERTVDGWATSATYILRAEDSQSGISSVAVQFGDREPETLAPISGVYTFTLTENTSVQIVAKDAVGNTTVVRIEESRVDTTAPEILQPVRKEPSWSYSAEYTISVADAQSNVASVTVQPIGGEVVTISPNEDGTYTYVATTNTSYIITAADRVGNTSHLTFTENRTDVTAPQIYDVSRDKTVWSQQATYTFRTEDDLSGVAKILVAQNGIELDLTKNEDGSYSFLALANDNYQISVSDVVGNNASVQIQEILIDVVPPVIQSVKPQESWNSSENVILFDVQDNAELVSVTVQDMNGKDIPVTGENGKFQTVVKENGDYIVTATDRAGNTSARGFTVWHIDTKSPSKPTLTSDANEQWVNKNVKLTASAVDDQSGVVAYWYSTSTSTFDASTWKKMDFTNGIGELELTEEQDVDYYIVAQDEVGRISEPEKIRVSIDKTAPTSLEASYQTGKDTGYNRNVDGTYIYNDKFSFHAEAKDPASGVVRYEYRTISRASGSSKWFSIDANETGISPVLTGLADDIYSVMVRAYDLAGNCSGEFTVTQEGTAVQNILENTPEKDALRGPAPVATLTTDSGAYNSKWTSKDVTVTLTGSAAISGIEYYEYAVDYTDPEKADVTWTKIPSGDGGFQLLLDRDINAVYSFRAISYAGNGSQTTSATVKIQKTAPSARTLTREKATGSGGWYTELPGYTVNSVEQNPYSAPVRYLFSVTHNGVTEPEFYYDGANAPKVASAGTWDITIIAEDDAGNRATVSGSTVHFDVDVMPPDNLRVMDGTENILSVRNGGDRIWNEIVSTDLTNPNSLTIFHNDPVNIMVSADGGESGLMAVYYQVVPENAQYSQNNTWMKVPSGGIRLEPNNKCHLFFMAVDGAGNITYFSAKSIVMDNVAPSARTLTADTAHLSKDGFYNGDVTIHYTAEDPASGKNAALSGLRSVSYRVLNGGVVTQSGQLYPGDGTSTNTQDGMVDTYSGSFVIDAQKNNSSDITVELICVDMAGNSSTSYIRSGEIKIDVDQPSMTASYDRNDVTVTLNGDQIFTGSRTLTVTATERNFHTGDSFVRVTDTDTGRTEEYQWVSDGDTHTAVIQISQDGHYTVAATIADTAGNKTSEMNFVEGTQAAAAFVIDNTAPEISVSYDNDDVRNEKYFNASRTATITVNERNFNPANINVAMTYTAESGNTITLTAGRWQHSGNTHWTTIPCAASGIYSMSVSGKDAAGNTAGDASFAGMSPYSFVVDTHISKPQFEDVRDGAAYSGEVIPGIELIDTNLEDMTVKVLRTQRNEIRKDVTEEILTDGFLKDIDGETAVAILDVFPQEESVDGIYTIQVSGTDKAGNFSTNEITFSINRFGSVYVYSEELIALNGTYLQELGKDLIVTEYNASGLVEGSTRVYITVDGAPIADPIYTVTPAADGTEKPGDSGWYEYQYVISWENFVRDGQYEIIISAEDTAGNIPENTSEDAAIRFAIDTTAPELPSIQGLEKQIYKADSIDVTVHAADNVMLAEIVVYINGEEVTRWEDLNSYSYEDSFTIPSGLDQQIEIVVTDKAGNTMMTSSENFAPGYAFHDSVTVSTNFFLRFFANKPLFYGSIAGLLGILILILLLIFKRRKKNTK